VTARAPLADFGDAAWVVDDFTAPANDARSPLALPTPAVKADRVRHLSALLNHPLGLSPRTTFADYLKAPGTNASSLRDLAVSPKVYKHRQTEPREQTGPMSLGTCAHTAVLEPAKFLSEYALWDERCADDETKVAPRRAGTKKWDAFILANPNKTIIRADEHATAMAIRDAVRAHPAAAKYLRAGEPEVAMWWCDGATERLCKGRADWITTDAGDDVLVGLKTRGQSGIPFHLAAAKLGYGIQWAHYCDGFAAITGRRPRMVEIVVDSAAPHDVAVYAIPDRWLEDGRAEIARLLQVLAECERANAWPGAAPEERPLPLPPAWMRPAGAADVGFDGLDAEAAS
jgi:PDDEXK-like uncharacterized protein DUF3799